MKCRLSATVPRDRSIELQFMVWPGDWGTNFPGFAPCHVHDAHEGLCIGRGGGGGGGMRYLRAVGGRGVSVIL